MPDLMSFPIDENDAVLVEVDFDQPEIDPVSRAGDLVRSAATSFDGALAHVRKAASVAVANFRDMDVRPDEVQIEFGVKLNAQAGAVIARTGVDGHLKVKLTWRRAAPERSTEDDASDDPAGT
jgi:Trypsin-co-occurring domain 1